ncbi:hypothetical protein BO99DRAFT_428470 [Aspergillus violaceofuscus CBS 115571]|uniref:Uncharacterized protein n=1 Tax=Aspergillus violaceofuscus (strain CBS 115571) TaxID=1450538 RepID=A0A2V5HQ11_ASPV1|nr:hypothetical protein BO99DRAFT_428470 [Aspergillus violaceofuscus CBS 115571]
MAASASSPLSFGENYAVLNLDWMLVLIDAVKDTPEGQAFTQSCNKWNNAIHQRSPCLLTIFSTLAFHLIAPYGEFATGSPKVLRR